MLFTSTAGILMTDEADAGQAIPVTATAVKVLVWYGCWGSLDLPPVAFLPEVGLAGILNGWKNLMDGAASSQTVSSKWRRLLLVKLAGTEGLLEGVFKTFFGTPLSR